LAERTTGAFDKLTNIVIVDVVGEMVTDEMTSV
jgi:hypothetical protein